MSIRTVFLAAGLSATAGMAHATDYDPLRSDSRMHAELLGASVAYLIDENCDALSLRKLRLLNKAFSLRKHAMSLGFSHSEVMDYVDSDTEQDRFRAIAEPLLASKGVVEGQEETYCTVGRAEIEKRSFTGSLLYER
ncbi:hypothetical protein ALP8811_00947 [Aliiroseovarius pelagivivens]|uniref:DUF5333 domain-containing protein n=1 Tax=Aliiroseovarius pelagivivens TaxID=1639690 RepID=A0A2R8AIS7_9RHOB|nr:DUF5333 domain-containing protein [Aliiroseovarius pelagivivens]SPF75952.1 hypothetical protein ALP8811_00947 [Aliiroseovarius pelagivivens]